MNALGIREAVRLGVRVLLSDSGDGGPERVEVRP